MSDSSKSSDDSDKVKVTEAVSPALREEVFELETIQ